MTFRFVFCLAALVACSASADTPSQAAACYNIADADARAYCLARAKHEPAQCYNIKSADLRSMCLAEVRK